MQLRFRLPKKVLWGKKVRWLEGLQRGNPLHVTSALTRSLSHLTDAPTSPGDFDKVLGVPALVAPSTCLFLASIGIKLSRGP